MHNDIIKQSEICINHLNVFKELSCNFNKVFSDKENEIDVLTKSIQDLSFAKSKLIDDINTKKNALSRLTSDTKANLDLYCEKIINHANNRIPPSCKLFIKLKKKYYKLFTK